MVAVHDRTTSVATQDWPASRLADQSRVAERWAPELLMAAGNQAEVLGRLASEGGYDLLVVGNLGAGHSKAVMGSVATSLAARAKVPLLVGGTG